MPLCFDSGNPGLADFYLSYLSHIYDAAPGSLAILARSLIGHSPHVSPAPLHCCSLEAQVEGVIEVIDSVVGAFGSVAKLVLIGHSVGSWVVLQARPSAQFYHNGDNLTCPYL